MRKSALYAFGLVVTSLVALGLVVLWSASGANAVRYHHPTYYFFVRQCSFAAVGVVVAVVIAMIDYRKLREWPWLAIAFVAVVMVLLCAVFFYPPTNGSYRWIKRGGINLQPSELAKIAVVVMIAVWMDINSWKVELFVKGALLPTLFLGVMAVPILCETDFGSTVVMFSAGMLVMFVAGVRLLHLLPLLGAVGAAVGVMVALNPNRMARLLDFASDSASSGVANSGAGYQAYNSLVAICNGGLFGVGLNQSMQKHYYLPEAHTDFILAVGAEELGVIFSICVVLLYLTFYLLTLYIARHASNRFGKLLVVGMSYIIFVQAMANIGVVCKALPTKGVALPFFSYGGTNMICSFIAVGTILSVGIHSYRDRKRLPASHG